MHQTSPGDPGHEFIKADVTVVLTPAQFSPKPDLPAPKLTCPIFHVSAQNTRIQGLFWALPPKERAAAPPQRSAAGHSSRRLKLGDIRLS